MVVVVVVAVVAVVEGVVEEMKDKQVGPTLLDLLLGRNSTTMRLAQRMQQQLKQQQ
jgi:hypothetical protein